MKRDVIRLWLGLFLCSSVVASPETDVSQRALDFSHAWATQREDPVWGSQIIPEYVHPQSSDSGLPSRYPRFLPKLSTAGGVYLFTKAQIGRVIGGTDPWILGGKETVYAVEILFTTVAQAKEHIIFFSKPENRSQFILMALDPQDNKWKHLNSYPYMAYFYEIPYFLKSWEKILGKGSVKNIPEVKQRLLDMVQKEPTTP